jgi:hypothetical protein
MFYALPAAMAAWQNRKYVAYGIATLLPLMRLGFYIPWGEVQMLSLGAVSTLIDVIALILIVYLVGRTALQTKRLRVLEGILSICASCKRIRNEKGEYEQIELYISEHSQASFSHGLCPECAKALYPKYAK